MKKSTHRIVLLLLVATMLLAACQPAATQPAAPQPTKPPAAAPTVAATAPASTQIGPTAVPTATIAPADPNATKISFWHSMAGDIGGKAIPQMANDFNSSQKACHVTPIYQGTYDDSLNKLKAGIQGKDVPAVVQLFDIGTRQLVDLKVMTPVQNFVDKEKYDLSDLEPNVLAYYTVENKLQSMPFNSSNPLLYFNKDMFKAAGLDPAKPPRTFEEFTAAARALTKKEGTKTTVYGANFAIYGWFFEQFLAVSGEYYVDKNNGRDGIPSKATFNTDGGTKILDWWKAMYDEGIMGNTGRKTVDSRNSFIAGQSAMIIESTATLRGILDSVGTKFQVGTAFLPRPNEEAYQKAGTIIGGASLWITNVRPQAEQDCAWEFIKFQSSAKVQSYWQTMTGYYPIRKAAYNEQLTKDWVAKYPVFSTAVEQLHASPNNRFTNGGLIGVFPVARAAIETTIEEILAGKSTPKAALDKAAGDITKAIEEYNLTMGLKP
jgi:sn-glycerol 3-phosphate transport system substrate-binding protein